MNAQNTASKYFKVKLLRVDAPAVLVGLISRDRASIEAVARDFAAIARYAGADVWRVDVVEVSVGGEEIGVIGGAK